MGHFSAEFTCLPGHFSTAINNPGFGWKKASSQVAIAGEHRLREASLVSDLRADRFRA